MKAPALPETDSIEELARFWDSHEVTEFEGQLEEVKEPVFERKDDAASSGVPEKVRAARRAADS